MTENEALKLAKKLGALFQPLTQDQAKLFLREVEGFRFEAAGRAIEDHRVNGGTKEGFIDWPRLWEGIRQAEKAAQAAAAPPAPRREETWCDVRRRLQPQLARAGDVEVVLRVHRGWWARCPQSAADRAAAARKCAGALVTETAKSPADADRLAGFLFVTPGEFQAALHDLRANDAGRAAPPAPDERVIDFVRRTTADPFARDVSDRDLLEWHFREAWRLVAARHPVGTRPRAAARAYVVAHARLAMAQLGLAPAAADAAARDFVDGERSASVAGTVFRDAAAPKATSPIDALRALVAAATEAAAREEQVGREPAAATA